MVQVDTHLSEVRWDGNGREIGGRSWEDMEEVVGKMGSVARLDADLAEARLG